MSHNITTEALNGPKDPDLDVTAQQVVQYLRDYGPNARVLLLVGGPKPFQTLKDEENGPLHGKLGILRLYGGEFSAVMPERQLTHHKGGVVTVMASYMVDRGLQGMRFGVIWAENADNLSETVRETAKMALTIEPRTWIESKDGACVAHLSES